jgi:phosphate starvation-inducible protein PhoH
MMKIIAVALMSTVLVSNNAMSAEESSEHLKNISKAVSAQLLRMKQKKTVEGEKRKASEASFKVKTSEGVVTPQQAKKIDAKPDVVLSAEKQQQALKQASKNKQISRKNKVSNQQKNDHLRLRIQDIVNSNPD